VKQTSRTTHTVPAGGGPKVYGEPMFVLRPSTFVYTFPKQLTLASADATALRRYLLMRNRFANRYRINDWSS
jgi:hypothetical protein